MFRANDFVLITEGDAVALVRCSLFAGMAYQRQCRLHSCSLISMYGRALSDGVSQRLSNARHSARRTARRTSVGHTANARPSQGHP